MAKTISTIKAKIARLNINAFSSKLFDNLETNERESINSKVFYSSNEEPIFCFYLSENYWWLTTNIRLVIFEDNFVKNYLYEDIHEVLAKDIFEDGESNQECDRLQLLLNNNEEINLKLEVNTWFSVLNLLNFLRKG